MVLSLALLTGPPSADAQSHPYHLRNQNPFLQVFGLPVPEGGALTPPGTLQNRLVLSLTNHADSGETSTETIVLDGESYYLDAGFRYGLTGRWEVGVDLPYVAHRSGRLDNFIEGWHDTFGLTNGERQGPSNRLQLTYRRDGITEVDLRNGGGGIGDVRVSGAYQLRAAGTGPAVALRGVVKLPTGNEHHLRGSGAADVAVTLEATSRTTLADRPLDLYGQAGALVLGQGDLLSEHQKSRVPFASLGLMWRWKDTVDLRVQMAMQGKYFASGLSELGGSTASVAIGGGFRLRRLGVELDVALVEDLISDATPDFGLYFCVKRTLSAAPG
jgi:hypothetical protein